MRIAFMGTPDFSIGALKALLSAGHEIICVYCQPPRRSGRGKKERPTPVHAFAETMNIPVKTPLNFKDADECHQFRNLNLDLAIVVAYGLILPQEILDAPKHGCLNIHASLLPRWRGAAPIQRAIMAGDNQTGVGIMQMEAGLDTGPVIHQKTIDIEEFDTAGTLHDKLSILGAKAIVEAIDMLPEVKAATQSEDGVTYAKKINKAEAHINWSKTATELKNHIHGLSPFPGAWTEINGERIKILNVELIEKPGPAGQMIGAPLIIACGENALSIKTAQRAGKGPMGVNSLLNGFDVEIGSQFS